MLEQPVRNIVKLDEAARPMRSMVTCAARGAASKVLEYTQASSDIRSSPAPIARYRSLDLVQCDVAHCPTIDWQS